VTPDSEEGSSSRQRAVELVRRISRRRFWTSTKGILSAVAAIVTITAFVLRFWPSSEACGPNSATLANPQVHAGTLETYLRRTSTADDPTAGYDPNELDDQVKWASVAIAVVGHKGKFLTLRWSVVDARTGQSGDLPQNRTAVEFQPPGCGPTTLRPDVGLGSIPPERRVYVTFDLFDESKVLLAPREARTPVFTTPS